MLAGDHHNSVLSQVSEGQVKPVAYMVYGYNRVGGGGLRFNGEHEEAHTGGYLLGMGFRAFNPVLMRFNSPDGYAWSPFGEGGLNGYGYDGDPVNYTDPSGHTFIGNMLRRFGLTTRDARAHGAPIFLRQRSQARPARVSRIQGKHIERLQNSRDWRLLEIQETEARFQVIANSASGRSRYEAENRIPFAVGRRKAESEAIHAFNAVNDAYNWAVDNRGNPGITRQSAAVIKHESAMMDVINEKNVAVRDNQYLAQHGDKERQPRNRPSGSKWDPVR